MVNNHILIYFNVNVFVTEPNSKEKINIRPCGNPSTFIILFLN